MQNKWQMVNILKWKMENKNKIKLILKQKEIPNRRATQKRRRLIWQMLNVDWFTLLIYKSAYVKMNSMLFSLLTALNAFAHIVRFSFSIHSLSCVWFFIIQFYALPLYLGLSAVVMECKRLYLILDAPWWMKN